MNEITCKHCGHPFDEQQNPKYCPTCNFPTPAQQESDLGKSKNIYIYLFIGLVIFCAFMIVWLPRVNNP